MKKCKITVMKIACYKDLMEKYKNPMKHACDVIVHGKLFRLLLWLWHMERKISMMVG